MAVMNGNAPHFEPIQTGNRPLDIRGHEDTLQDFETILGFPCEGLVSAWSWRNKEKGLVTEAFLGKSPAFLTIIETVEKLRGTSAPLLINGESGTGKELLAHFIHQLEDNESRPFVVVNCSAIPENLIESQLFGHEKGSFTGAIAQHKGYFEMANGGDIFLDEIGTLRMDLQVKLLRVLQDKKIRRIGGTVDSQLDFRVIAATNEDLETLVRNGKFREDLYHRLSVVPLRMPPLRERVADIPLLVKYFAKKYRRAGQPVVIAPEALALLQAYSWPGNIRELENMIHRLVILGGSRVITKGEVMALLLTKKNGNPFTETRAEASLKGCLNSSEQEIILQALQRHNWNISASARYLKVSRTTLYKKIRDYQLFKD